MRIVFGKATHGILNEPPIQFKVLTLLKLRVIIKNMITNLQGMKRCLLSSYNEIQKLYLQVHSIRSNIYVYK